MCIRVVERYAVCKCVYFIHGTDQCPAFGSRGHLIEDKTVLVGHTCPSHAHCYAASSSTPSALDSLPAAMTTYSHDDADVPRPTFKPLQCSIWWEEAAQLGMGSQR